MTIKPLGNRILGEPIRRTQQGLIVKPDAYAPDDLEFRVVAVGSGKLRKDGSREPIPIEVGWRVLSHAYAAKHVELDDAKLRLIDVSDILLVLPP